MLALGVVYSAVHEGDRGDLVVNIIIGKQIGEVQ